MAYGVTNDGTSVEYWIDHGDTLPLYWRVKKSDGTYELLSDPNTFNIRPKGWTGGVGDSASVSLVVSGDRLYASGEFDTTSLKRGKTYEVFYSDGNLDVTLHGTLTTR